MLGHATVISGVAACGSYVLTAGYDRRTILWNSTNKGVLGIGYHDNLVNQVRFSPNGKLALSTSSDYTARLWTVPDMQLVAVLNGHQDDVESADFNPQCPVIATASYDDTIGIYGYDGHHLFYFRGHESDVNDVFWKDENTLVSTGDDGTVRHWDLSRRTQYSSVRIGEGDIDSICNGPGERIFCGNDEGDIVTLRADRIDGKFSAHQAGIKSIAYIRQLNRVVSTGYDGLVKFWDVSTDGELKCLSSCRFPSLVWPRSCAYLSGDKYVFSSFGSRYAVLDCVTHEWDVQGIVPSGSLNAVTEVDDSILAIGDAGTLVDAKGNVKAAVSELCNTLRPCGPSLLTGGQSGAVRDLVHGRTLYVHHSPINGGGDVLSTQDGILCVLGTYTGEVLAFLSSRGAAAHFHRKEQLSIGSIKDIALAPDISMAVVSSGQAVFFDTLSFCVLRVSDGHAEVANACVPITRGFASVGRDRNLILWNSRGEMSQRIKTPHRNSIKSLCAVGNTLVMGDYRGYISRFDLESYSFHHLERVCEAGISCIAKVHGMEAVACTYAGRLIRLPV